TRDRMADRSLVTQPQICVAACKHHPHLPDHHSLYLLAPPLPRPASLPLRLATAALVADLVKDDGGGMKDEK
ncbi:MAG TPA: hypothetical protein V6D16_08020, partial [Candidatus Obscuribacterales bacterium]